MYLDKEKISAFMGTGSANENGQTLEEFLEKYDAKKYDNACNTVDMLIFRMGNPKQLLMIRRRNHPSIGDWAVPGGFVNIREDLYDAAKRELEEETGVTGVPMIQLRTFGEPDRDPRWRVITTTYMALIDEDIPVKAGDDAAEALWFDVDLKLPGGRPEGELELTLHNKEKDIRLSAKVLCERKYAGTKLYEPHYSIIYKEGLASDHCNLITDAVLRLEDMN